jgi:predicted 3-demethylubiquinone-9 3-methyltransferase (glyoxalase superfamily)
MQKISPFLWFDDKAEDSARFYASIFGDSSIDSVARYGKLGPGPEGSVMTLGFRLEGREFAALNGGPVFSFTPAVSFFVNCGTESEIDALWGHLSGSGTVFMELQSYPFSRKFGWVTDRFGVSWQLNLGTQRKSIQPFLTFAGPQHGRAEEAMNSYISIFKNSRIERLERFEAGDLGSPGTVKHGRFSLDGLEFMAMDSDKNRPFGFTPAISFFVNCETQEEIDELWERLSERGKKGQCGWLEDEFGVSWQVVPAVLPALMSGDDPERVRRVAQAMFAMTKLDIASLERAFHG